MTEKNIDNIIGRIIPIPREASVADGDLLKLEDGFGITIKMDSLPGHLENIVKGDCIRSCSAAPSLTLQKAETSLPAGGYTVAVTDHIEITAGDITGVRYAFSTLRQASEPLRGVKKSLLSALPRITVKDWPAMGFRGVHICIFPETDMPEIEKQIRLAAYYKMNYIVLEPWGVFPYECEPDFCWPESGWERSDFEHLRDVAQELGVTIIPQINILGHASWARSCAGKHTILNYHPEYAPLFEPDGWCWCLTNPETTRVLESLVAELHEFFGNPPYFHIGCDEAHSLGSCSNCAEHKTSELAARHINHFHDFLASRGARIMMWHDMLIPQAEYSPRYVACGKADAADFLAAIPRDVVICDWQYDTDLEATGGKWETTRHFLDAGFDTMLCPWFNMGVILSEGRFIAANNGTGLLATTWHYAKGSYLYNMYFGASCAAWNPEYVTSSNVEYAENFSAHIRQMDLDAGIEVYEYFGRISHYQIDVDKTVG